MFTLVGECHFWSLREDIQIKSSDYGAFRYMRKAEDDGNLAQVAKRDYVEQRNGVVVLKNSRKAGSGGRLKDNLKRLEELLRSHKVVHFQWREAPAQLLFLFANGIVAHICIDIYTGDIQRMVFEKYLVSKLAADVITDAFFTRSHVVLAYNTNQLTVVHLQKPSTRAQGPEKLSNMEPRIFHAIIPGPSERKLARRMSTNSSSDLFVIWTNSSQNEVYPWRPTIRDQDRANIHVFKLKEMQLELMSYCWTENDPLCVDFLRSSESQILVVEQKISRKGDITAEICSYEISTGKMQRTALTSIAVGAEICSHAFSPDQEKLFLGTAANNLYLHDLVMQSTKFLASIEIMPLYCSWHCDSCLIMVANERAQMQCFDLALTVIGTQLQSEDLTPTNLLDLSLYFTTKPNLVDIRFSRKPALANFTHTYAQTDCFLLLQLEHGPIGCLRFFCGAGMRGDIHNSGLTADVIIDKYLALNQLEKAVNLLNALNWETYGAMCLISLHKIVNYVIFRSELKPNRIELMQRALNTFTDQLSEETKDEFSDQVFDLKRRFFFFLLRRNLFSEAFLMAQDIEDYDLFMDLYNVTKSNVEFVDISGAAFSQAATILQEEDRANGNLSLAGEYRSESACSQSTYSDLNSEQLHSGHLVENPLKNYVPPLPSFKSKVFNAEMIKINIPKPELRIDATQQIVERTRPTPPPPPPPTTTSQQLATTTTMTRELLMAPTTISINETMSTKNASNVVKIHQNLSSLPWQETKDKQTIELTAPNNTPRSAVEALAPSTSQNAFPHTTAAMAATGNTHLHYAAPVVIASVPPPPPVTVLNSYTSHVPMISSSMSLPMPTYQPKFYQHPLISGNIPATHHQYATTTTTEKLNASSGDHQTKQRLQKKPTASILSNSSAVTQNNATPATFAVNGIVGGGTGVGSNGIVANKELSGGKSSGGGEKNKVKFSDTVQVAVVPEIPRKEKPLASKRNGYSRPLSRNHTNPRKELADSLPLCHPHGEYLKDFNPLSTELPRPPARSSANKEDPTTSKSSSSATTTATTSSSSTSIKVVHFGVV